MNEHSREELAPMSSQRRTFTVALAVVTSLFAISGITQDSTTTQAEKETETEEATEDSKYTKESVKNLTSEELGELIKDCGDSKLSDTDCLLFMTENFRRMQENDRPVDLDKIKSEQPFGSIYQQESDNGDERSSDMPKLVDSPQSPPNSYSVPEGTENVVTDRKSVV